MQTLDSARAITRTGAIHSAHPVKAEAMKRLISITAAVLGIGTATPTNAWCFAAIPQSLKAEPTGPHQWCPERAPTAIAAGL